ncbi:hypothetical protein [Desulfosarcina sp.]|uniref:hypothetical protein n=1 Tax=Desulfosarcina sp. TaxID=2027861 RepID=UPI00397053B3
MSKREKIIVSVMAATVLLGGYIYFMPWGAGSRGDNQPEPGPAALDFSQKVIQKLKEDTSLAKELYTIRMADRQWDKSPFLKNEALLSDTRQDSPADAADAVGARLDLVYSGFLEVGTRRLAIINGIEYALGEAIDNQGRYVRRIFPHQVEIGRLNTPDVVLLKYMEYEAISGKQE